ncbi:MAG: glycoside hydrolase family 99-like domain-containing protein [Acidimicrobiia bacterium]|jgi:lipopolysaccharide biosynthesis protein
MSDVRALALYLPQFHPIPENDAWWGPGFTEWRNVVRAKSLFPGHSQPQIPADLGFCDLRVSETREAQAALAREHGISGFVYYHYWFQGRRLLDRPFREVLESGRPDFGFALCWANEDWTRAWDGASGETLVRQDYSLEDDRAHIRELLPAFADPRSVRVDGRPLFLVYTASRLPEPERTTDLWREEAVRAGIGDLYLCRVEHDQETGDPTAMGFDAAIEFQPAFAELGRAQRRTFGARLLRRLHLTNQAYRWHRIYDYAAVVDRMLARPSVPYKRFPCVSPGWDNTPRRRRQAVIFRDSSPGEYERWLRGAIADFAPFGPGEDLVFVNAWNEWAEGNHLEPCRQWGRGYLEATRRVLGGG